MVVTRERKSCQGSGLVASSSDHLRSESAWCMYLPHMYLSVVLLLSEMVEKSGSVTISS